MTCSFVGGGALCEAMCVYGAPRVLTTSGAAVGALRAEGARRVAVVHPYQAPVDAYLAVGLTALGLGSVEDVYTVAEEQVVDAVVAGDRGEADAVFVACTALPTYDVLPRLRERLGKPVVGAVQATARALRLSVPAASRR
ncbi:hypothetical protein [Streptomyces sp. NPDC046939]|uniref:aspartate racemase/maleate isomerase family protein n=1 Tax=Streptomyces sp. NPDC046939 TaxID=3155376 RepID=UPI0033E08E51